MYLVSLFFENARRNATGTFDLPCTGGALPKWTVLPHTDRNGELLRLIVAALGGARFVRRLPLAPGALCRDGSKPLHIEFVVAAHPWDSGSGSCGRFGSGIVVDPSGRVAGLAKRECRLLPPNTDIRRPAYDTGNTPFLLLAYGPHIRAHDGTDDFTFSDPYFRVTRFHSLFSGDGLITDPVAFLTRLHYKGVRVSRYPAVHTMESFARLFREHLGIETADWLDRTCNLGEKWSRLSAWQKRALLPILDAARHLIDAFPRSGTPLQMPALLLFDRPDRSIASDVSESFPAWLSLVDRLFPKVQIILTASEGTRRGVPRVLYEKLLRPPSAPDRSTRERPVHIPRNSVLLIDVDGRLPNLALMKISSHLKQQGRQVVLGRRDCFVEGAEQVWASCVFSSPASQNRVGRLRKYYGESLMLGGSGVDLGRRLPPEIEQLPPDHSLYPELQDRAIGFLTRGCPFDCPFCIVPAKEGTIRQVSDLDSLLGNGCRKLILLDDNILAHPKAAGLLEEMAARDIEVNFNQTLDIRLLDRSTARILKRVRCANTGFTRRVYHFSLNDTSDLERVRDRYGMMDFSRRDNVEFICMYGYNTTLAEDVERFSFLRSLPGAYVFVQQYQPILGGPQPGTIDFFGAAPDELIDRLVKIVFPQNMKSMEKYYRWLSKRYALAFGRLHMALVDTIFRYNSRDRKGLYMSSLAGTRTAPPSDKR